MGVVDTLSFVGLISNNDIVVHGSKLVATIDEKIQRATDKDYKSI
jgi:hypothetical protein